MILRTCDRCGKEMDPIYFPPFAINNCSCGDNPENCKQEVYVTAKDAEGKIRPVDLCDECNAKIYDEIFYYAYMQTQKKVVNSNA